MKVAIIHYWLCNRRGGERVIEALCEMFPQADIFTLVHDKDRLQSKIIAEHKVTPSFLQKLPFAKRHYQFYLPLMPMALEQFDLRGYDLILSSESGPAKGVIVPPDARHLCYCHSPMRYIWDMTHDYMDTASIFTKVASVPLFHYLRMWDALSANRVDRFVANSRTVKRRIASCYRREAEVIAPPVDVEAFAPAQEREDFYLLAGELVAYKRPDLAVEACNALGKRLVIIGGGPMEEKLRKIAGPTVTMLGRCDFNVLRDHYARCKALLFPGLEDFGIVPVEAMASGAPVLAYGKGGILDSAVEGETALFFNTQTCEALVDCIERFETHGVSMNAQELTNHAKRFSASHFKTRIQAEIDAMLQESDERR